MEEDLNNYNIKELLLIMNQSGQLDKIKNNLLKSTESAMNDDADSKTINCLKNQSDILALTFIMHLLKKFNLLHSVSVLLPEANIENYQLPELSHLMDKLNLEYTDDNGLFREVLQSCSVPNDAQTDNDLICNVDDKSLLGKTQPKRRSEYSDKAEVLRTKS